MTKEEYDQIVDQDDQDMTKYDQEYSKLLRENICYTRIPCQKKALELHENQESLLFTEPC